MIRRVALSAAFAALILASTWSYASDGLVRVLVDLSLSGETGLDRLRTYVLGWGVLAPAVYVVAVTIEVMVAPIPGTLLYAPGGAIFGGFWGGTLSLVGNVLGASGAAWIGLRLGEPWVARKLGDRYGRLKARLGRRGLWVVFLLRVNPFTSSDLVSYAAGAIGVRVGIVALGTLAGMAPLCYAQSYMAESLFEVLPGSGAILIGFGVAYFAIVVWLLVRPSR